MHPVLLKTRQRECATRNAYLRRHMRRYARQSFTCTSLTSDVNKDEICLAVPACSSADVYAHSRNSAHLMQAVNNGALCAGDFTALMANFGEIATVGAAARAPRMHASASFLYRPSRMYSIRGFEVGT